MRATFEDLAWNFDFGQAGIVAVFLAPAARIFWNTARFLRIAFVLRRPPIGRPFPRIADHVVDAVAVWRERSHWRGAVETILALVFVREIALPGIGQVFAVGREFVAPGKFGA